MEPAIRMAWIFFIPLNLHLERGNIMQKSKLLVALLGTLAAMPAMADSPFSANVSLTTNYIFHT